MKLKTFNSLRMRTILIFTLINMALIVLLALFSYLFVRNLYLNQFSEQLHLGLRMAASEIDPELINFLDPANPTLANQFVKRQIIALGSLLQLSNLFLFDENWQIEAAANKGDAISALLINKSLLRRLAPGQTFVSHPFQDEQGQWYLWAFKRMNQKHYIGVRGNARRLAEINRLSGKFLLFGLVGIMLTLLGALFVAHSLHQPLQAAIHFSRQIGQGNFNSTPPKTRLKELKQLNQALLQMREALHQRNQEKEQLLAQIAHDLRNPLGSIELLIGLVQDDLPDEHADQIYLNKIRSEVRQLKKQIGEFLEYSRPRQPEITNLNLAEVIEEIKAQFEEEARKKNIQIISQLEQEHIAFDREHLNHVLSNLIANSLQALDGKAGIIMIRSTQNRLEVEDNGPGISNDLAEKIFQPFFSTKSEGVGLGLTICRRLCRLNGAKIELINNPGGGALFRIQTNAFEG